MELAAAVVVFTFLLAERAETQTDTDRYVRTSTRYN